RHGRNLHSTRPAVFRLIALGKDFHFADRLDVHTQHLAVVARIHGRDAVHHDVVLALAAESRGAAGGYRAIDAGRKSNSVKEVSVLYGQGVDLLAFDRKRSLAALRLHERRFGGDTDSL